MRRTLAVLESSCLLQIEMILTLIAERQCVGRTFAHSIFEVSPSIKGFHATHETPSRSATVSYVCKRTLLATKGGSPSHPLPELATGQHHQNSHPLIPFLLLKYRYPPHSSALPPLWVSQSMLPCYIWGPPYNRQTDSIGIFWPVIFQWFAFLGCNNLVIACV